MPGIGQILYMIAFNAVAALLAAYISEKWSEKLKGYRDLPFICWMTFFVISIFLLFI
ncbi:MAG: hypothetical protein U0O25_08875 [Succinivibrio sp.]|uniref:hypothetical protein n=1 Tax=Succinivibrio sp. TaxID=2053619 RepID=UPI002F929D58|nr:hypothetical protein [Succinatimonas hippei]